MAVTHQTEVAQETLEMAAVPNSRTNQPCAPAGVEEDPPSVSTLEYGED
jgi:hypothetical protein